MPSEMPSNMGAPKTAAVATPSKYQAPAAVSAAVIRERRKAAAARSRISTKSGITVAAPPIQPGLVAIDYAQVRPPCEPPADSTHCATLLRSSFATPLALAAPGFL